LGSLPGEKSLEQGQYYANKQNAFWFLISHIVGIDLVALSYEERLATLLEHGIGLWDVVADAKRTGSLDSSIREHQANDLVQLIETLPNLCIVAFNGRTAAKLGIKQLASSDMKFKIVELPSSSPAFTLPVSKKLDAWMALGCHATCTKD
jgi:hypoxanthine-DNA glycosylase